MITSTAVYFLHAPLMPCEKPNRRRREKANTFLITISERARERLEPTRCAPENGSRAISQPRSIVGTQMINTCHSQWAARVRWVTLLMLRARNQPNLATPNDYSERTRVLHADRRRADLHVARKEHRSVLPPPRMRYKSHVKQRFNLNALRSLFATAAPKENFYTEGVAPSFNTPKPKDQDNGLWNLHITLQNTWLFVNSF